MSETPDELRARLDALHVAATDGWPSTEPAVLFRDALEDAWPTIDGLLAQLVSWRTAAEAELRRRGQVEEERDALLARLATAEAEVQSGWRMHANACERHIALGIRIMTAFAGNRPLIEVLDLIGDDLNEVDAVDDESIALYERAKAAVARREQP